MMSANEASTRSARVMLCHSGEPGVNSSCWMYLSNGVSSGIAYFPRPPKNVFDQKSESIGHVSTQSPVMSFNVEKRCPPECRPVGRQVNLLCPLGVLLILSV